MSTITVISTAQRRVVAARRRVRRWGKDCHAAVALEFVLIIPMLVGLIAFGNEAVGVRLQQKVLQDFSSVTAEVVAGYHKHGPDTGVTLTTDSSGVTEADTRSLGPAVTSKSHDSSGAVKLLSLKDLTSGMRVLLAEIHPVGEGTLIGPDPCSQDSAIELNSSNPFTCQIIGLAPANNATTSILTGRTCDTLPAVWDKTKLSCTDPSTAGSTGTETKITNPTSCGSSGDGDGYRITWRYGYDTTDGAAEKVCKCADTLTVQKLTVYDKKVTAVVNRKVTSTGGGFDLSSHGVPIVGQGSTKLPRAGVLVWAASYRKGLFTGILNKDTIERLTLQSWNWAASVDESAKSTYSAAGIALVDASGKNMISCYGKDPSTTP